MALEEMRGNSRQVGNGNELTVCKKGDAMVLGMHKYTAFTDKKYKISELPCEEAKR